MKDETTYLINKLVRQITICCSFMVLISVTTLLLYFDAFPKDLFQPAEISIIPYDSKYDVALLGDSEEDLEIKYGHELFINTPKYIGPDNGKQELAFAGNRLACNNCHLYSGTKAFSASLIGIINRFPQFRGRENKIGTIEERINGCMERSMNGRTLPPDGKEMKAFVQYLTWLSRFAPEDGKINGQGFVKIAIPNRKVNLTKGQQVFKTICVECHGIDGQGKKAEDGFTYEYPPLWGEDSYNNGAGMNRVITAAQFIKANMPFGTTYEAPLLSDEESYDVAGYINQQKRPIKLNSEKDFPDLKKKPVSTPYPPYADSFPIDQHQLGPFEPIISYYKKEYNILKTK
jgi:thiosulfate dehydrogenase